VLFPNVVLYVLVDQATGRTLVTRAGGGHDVVEIRFRIRFGMGLNRTEIGLNRV